MINPNHKYKVTNSIGVTLITYDDYMEACEFRKNMAKNHGSKLQIKHNEKREINKNTKA